MTGDSIFVKGSTHNICQDYSISEVAEFGEQKHGAAIVCDGCSASPKSEIGAALLPHIFLRAYGETRYQTGFWKDNVPENAFNSLLKSQVSNRVSTVIREAGLPDHAFDATIVAAISEPEKDLLRLYMWGDGHIYINSDDGDILHSAKYLSGAPYYFSYSLDREREYMYQGAFGKFPRAITTQWVKPDGLEETTNTELRDYHCWTVPLKGVSMVQVFSDGLESFVEADNKAVLVRDVLPQVGKFKLSHGAFVQRRVRRALKDLQKQNITHYDDFSSAALCFEDLTLARGK